MPLLARYVGSVAIFFSEILAKYLGQKAAIAIASFLAWLSILAAFVTTVSVCLNSLYSTVQAGVAAAEQLADIIDADRDEADVAHAGSLPLWAVE